MKIYVKANDQYEDFDDDYDYIPDVSELYRLAEQEVLPETELYRLSKRQRCSIDEDSFDWHETGSAWGAYVTYTINIELRDSDINIWDFATGANQTMIDFGNKSRNDYFELSISIDIKNSEVVGMAVVEADAYDNGSYSDYYSNKLSTVFDFDAILEYIRPYAESAAIEIHGAVSNI